MKKTKSKNRPEMDTTYILKLTLFLIVGSQWLYLANVDSNTQIPVPVGLVLGLVFASHDHFRIDRKIEYALLLLAMFIGFWLPMGVIVRY
ncbi:MAG TPA: hypothetical protein PKA02_03130 [Candidatus Saccharibacteria bacterium]|nr:hypothetical protein [Candidatus Saccharibacteria bacterium]